MSYLNLPGSIVSGILFGCLIFGGCDTTLILALMTLAVMFSGASVAGGSANVVDMSPNFCGKLIFLTNARILRNLRKTLTMLLHFQL